MRQMLVRCYDHRVSQTGDFTDTGKGGFQRNALNLAGLYFRHPLVHFSQPCRLHFRVVPVQVFRETPDQFANLFWRPMAGFRNNLLQGHRHALTLHRGRDGFNWHSGKISALLEGGGARGKMQESRSFGEGWGLSFAGVLPLPPKNQRQRRRVTTLDVFRSASSPRPSPPFCKWKRGGHGVLDGG